MVNSSTCTRPRSRRSTLKLSGELSYRDIVPVFDLHRYISYFTMAVDVCMSRWWLGQLRVLDVEALGADC
jgi:hypothetical protein